MLHLHDLGPGSGLKISLWALPFPPTVCKYHAYLQLVTALL